MGSKLTTAYSVLSVLAFVFLASWFAFTFFQTRTNNYLNAASTFEDLKNSTAITFRAAGRLDAPHFRAFVRSVFLEIPSIDVLTISTVSGGIHFVYARHAEALVAPRVVGNRWSGSIRYSSLTQNMFSGTLPLAGNAGTSPFRIRAVFTTLSRANLYSMARTLLIFLLSFVILTGIVILIVPSAGAPREERDRRRRRRPMAEFEPDEENVEPERAPSSSRRGASRRRDRHSAEAAALDERPEEEKSSVIILGPPPESTPGTERQAFRNTQGSSSPAPGAAGSNAAQPSPEGSSADLQTSAVPDPEIVPEETAAENTGPEIPISVPQATDDSLPPGIRLPSLREVAAQEYEEHSLAGEISLYEELARSEGGPLPSSAQTSDRAGAGPIARETAEAGSERLRPTTHSAASPFDVTEIDDHADGPRAPDSSATDYRSAEDELADIDDFEDLEQIDGSSPGESAEELPAPRASARRQRSVPDERPSPPRVPMPSLEDELETEIAPIILDEEDQTTEPRDTSVESSESASGEPLASEVEELLPVEAEDELIALGSGESEEEPATTAAVHEVTQAHEDEFFFDLPLHPDEDFGARAATTKPGSRARELFNPVTGLAWRDHLEQRLSFELDRAASFDQDLSLSIVRFRKPVDEEARVNYAREIRAYFPFHDLCFDYGPDAFAIVLPNMDVDQAIHSMENFNDKMNTDRPGSPKMLFGLSARNGRLLGGERLLSEAEGAAEKARGDRKNSIFALRVDPGKYREYIKSTLK